MWQKLGGDSCCRLSARPLLHTTEYNSDNYTFKYKYNYKYEKIHIPTLFLCCPNPKYKYKHRSGRSSVVTVVAD